MGRNFIKRPRMQSLPAIDPVILASIGQHDIIYEKYDEQQIFDMVNTNLDAAQARLNTS